jgi:hypothetical protein
MTDRTLSPAAQAVLDAAADVYWDWSDMSPASSSTIAAAAIRALAYNVYSDEHVTCGGSSHALMIDMDDILAIAAELEVSHG